MPALLRSADGREIVLAHDVLLGRAPATWIQLKSRHASGRHASLLWAGAEWHLRDLGSRNGTTVDGTPLEKGATARLKKGSVIALGGADEQWTLTDASPPVPAAIRLDAREIQLSVDGYLALADPAAPEVTIFEHSRLGWLQETMDGDMDKIEHGAVVLAGGASYRLHLTGEERTQDLAEVTPRFSLATGVLRLTVSPDEENVDAALACGDAVLPLPPSVHWYLILVLARARWRDDQEDDHPERERGWVQRDDLCRQLRTTVQKLNVDIHRVRQMLARSDIPDGSDIVERRSTTGQLRLGVRAADHT